MKRQLVVILFMGLFAAFVFSSMLIVGGCGGDGDEAYLAPAPSINTRGGDGGSDTGSGGGGGWIDIVKEGGTGPTEILSSGTVDASFTPTAAAPILGGNPVMITADTTIPLFPDVPSFVEPGADEPYLLSFDPTLYISDGDGDPTDDVVATGLSVAAGATLTLPLNGVTVAGVFLSDDLENNGTITTLDVDATQRGALELQANNYWGASGSAIDTSATVPGQNGGYFYMVCLAGFYNRGAINTAGADNAGGNGGSGGWTAIICIDELLENTGAITTAGGDGGAGDGGAGGYIEIVSVFNSVYNSGAINSTGGNGTGSGGPGDFVGMYAGVGGDVSGELRNSGNVTAAGGNGAGGDGGDGGYIDLLALAADLLNSAALNSAGGDTSEAASDGGDGGDIWVACIPDIIAGVGDNLLLAGNIDSSGGDALATGTGDGGDGGSVEIVFDPSGWYFNIPGLPVAPTTQRLALLGYGSIDTCGGSGNQGGYGNSVYVENWGAMWDGANWVDDPSGDVTNQATITARGGSVAADASTPPAMGGYGGFVSLVGNMDPAVINPAGERTNNSANIDTSGGDSYALVADPGWNAGAMDIVATNDVTNTGRLTANGGSDNANLDTPGTGFGASGPPWIELYTILDTTTNSGTINANGGDGETLGGFGGGWAFGIYLGQEQVVNRANISARGGDADVGVAGSVGGDGGVIWFDDVDVPDNTGTLDVSGGAGETPGAPGTIFP